MNQAAAVPQAKPDELPLPSRPVAFLWHYICARPWHFGGLLALLIGAASCAVAVQYGMKLLVDAMAQGTSDRAAADVWFPLGLFIGLIVVENVFWRLGGWLGCRTVVASVVDLRVDLFKHLTGHPMRYFNEHFAGSLGNRISAVGQAAGAIYGGLAWKIVPPIVDFIFHHKVKTTGFQPVSFSATIRSWRAGAWITDMEATRSTRSSITLSG